MRTIVNRNKQSTGEDHGSVKGLKKETLTMLTADHPPSLPLMRKQGVKVPQIVCGRVQIQDQGQLPKRIHSSSRPHSWMTFGIFSLWNLRLPWGYTEPCAQVPAHGIRGVTGAAPSMAHTKPQCASSRLWVMKSKVTLEAMYRRPRVSINLDPRMALQNRLGLDFIILSP